MAATGYRNRPSAFRLPGGSGRICDFDVRLILAADEVPHARLGACRLGLTTWIDPMKGRDADDLCYTRVNGDTSAAGMKGAA